MLALCQSVTEDGSLSKDEILAIRGWLHANQSSDLPAIEFLAATLQRIIADGKVTKDERQELYRAIEKVLPPEARRDASEQRRAVEANERERVRNELDAKKSQAREERERNRPLCSVNFMVAGVHYEGRSEIISAFVRDGARAFLARDPHNRYSQNAVEVRLQNGMQIGFVPEHDAVEVAPLLDQGCPHSAYVTKILTGGRVPIPVVQARIYRQDALVEGLVSAAEVPAKQVNLSGNVFAKPGKAGCVATAILVMLAILGFTWTFRLL